MQEIIKKKQYYNVALIYLIAIILGIFSGYSHILFLHTLGLFISDLFIKIFKCISMPIIWLSIIVALSGYDAEAGMRKVWQRTLAYTLSTTIIAAGVSCLLYLLIKPGNTHTYANALVNNSLAMADKKIGYIEHITSLIPSDIFSPFLEHQVMAVLLMGVVVGIAIRYIPHENSKAAMVSFFKGAHDIFLVITGWVVAIIPLGLYGFITATALQFQKGMDIKGIGQYLLVIVLANLTQGLIILPLWLAINRIPAFATMKGMLPALVLAFFSKSSAGTLPVTMATAEKNLHINPAISRFVLPFCTSLNMNGCAAFIFTTVIYLMQNHGIDITPMTLFIWIIIATIAAVGNAGVPMGCFFLSASLLASMNIPITLMGVILPFYSLIDMLETALNVWSDSCVAKVVDTKNRDYLSL